MGEVYTPSVARERESESWIAAHRLINANTYNVHAMKQTVATCRQWRRYITVSQLTYRMLMERFLSTYVPVASIMCFVVVSTFRQHGGGCVAAIRHEEHSSRDVSTCHIVPAMHTWWAAVVWVGLCGVGGAMYAQAPSWWSALACYC